MNNFKVTINNVEYIFDKEITIKEACELVGINIPSILLNDDIDYVIANSLVVCSSTTIISDGMHIITNDESIDNLIKTKIEELHAKLKTSCKTCPVVTCPLKKMFERFNLSDNGSTYKGCAYYINGIKSKFLVQEESHPSLEETLKNTRVHKLAIIEPEMEPKIGEILNKGFNEVITSDFIKKFKIIEESALFLQEFAKALDSRQNMLPVYILEDPSLQNLVSKANQKNILHTGSIVEIATKLFKRTLDYNKLSFVYITEDSFDNETHQEVTYDYISKLPFVESEKINNVQRLLKLDNKQVNYNSFVNHLIELLNSKQKFVEDIYTLSDYEIKLKGTKVKISNIRYSDCNNSDIVLVLKERSAPNTPSLLYDRDVNFIYKHYLKTPGEF